MIKLEVLIQRVEHRWRGTEERDRVVRLRLDGEKQLRPKTVVQIVALRRNREQNLVGSVVVRREGFLPYLEL